MTGRIRFPGAVYRHGGEPDARFTLANERTFLAWIRTALALIAAGVALELVDVRLEPGLRLAASLVLASTGVFLPALAWTSWARTERALRQNEPLPGSALPVVLMGAVTVAGVLVTLAVVF